MALSAGALLVCLQILLSLSSRVRAVPTFRVVENTGGGVGRLNETQGSNYRFIDQFCPMYFNIDSSGYISVKNESLLDREAMSGLEDNQLRCGLSSSDSGIGIININIEIVDVNDQVPHFLGFTQPFRINLSETINTGSLIEIFRPTDNDHGLNGMTEFNIIAGNDEDYFELRVPETSNLTEVRDLFIVRKLDYDAVPGGMFNLSVLIRDLGSPPNSFLQTILIYVINEQDERPQFALSTYTFNVREDRMLGPGHIFGNVTATGSDNIKYEIKGGNEYVGIGNLTGDLYLKAAPPLGRVITFSVAAINTLTLEQSSTIVMVEISAVFNEALHFECYLSNIESSCPTGDINGTIFRVLENTDSTALVFLNAMAEADTFDVNLSLDPLNAPLTLTHVDGLLFSIKRNRLLDREQFQNITVMIRNAGNHAQVYAVIQFLVTDVNDNPPIFAARSYDTVVFEGSPAGRQLLQVDASDADIGENGSISYSITAVDKEVAISWFSIAPDTGVITLNSAVADFATVDGSVTLNVTATDNGTEPLSNSVSVTVSTVLSTSFSVNSYLEFLFSETADLLAKPSQDVYLEVLPQQDSGLLLYQQDLSGNTFSVSYRGGVVVAQLGGVVKNQTVDVAKDWVGIHVQTAHQQITGITVAAASAMGGQFLQNVSVQRCSNESSKASVASAATDHRLSVYIGGVNRFILLGNDSSLLTASFTGGIRNVVVGGTQLDLSCPQEQVNTRQGVISSFESCDKLSCTSARSVGCVDFVSEEPYCQCAGGFSAQACRISVPEDEETSYGPIRFKGSSSVALDLGYTFFADLAENTDERAASETSDGQKRRRRNAVSGDSGREVRQVVELDFRAVDLQDSVILNSQTSLSSHIIEILTRNGTSRLQYTIRSLDRENITSQELISAVPISLERETLYHLRATLLTNQVALEVLSREISVTSNSNSLWEFGEVPVLAEQPTTSLVIGGSLQLNSTSFFMGCITRVAINDIEVPLSGLLQASTSDGGFQVSDASGVIQHCNLCDIHECSNERLCRSEALGEVSCHCKEQYLEVNGSCVLPDGKLTTNIDNNTYYMIAGGAAGALLIFGVCVVSVIVVCRKKQEKRKERRYNVNGSSRINRTNQSRRGNDYSSNSIVKKDSFSSSMNANYTIDPGERRSSISTYQEHAEDGDPETNSPLHQNTRTRHKSCASVESGIKMDDIEMGTLSRRCIPTMEDSGHEVNSTDSNRTSVSDEVISSCNGRSPMPHARGAMSSMTSPEHRTPRTPLTPKEKKVMIPLRPLSSNLSQSEYDEEEGIETESFHTRVSSSSGMGNSMQNQGRGSDTDSSKISDNSRWYRFPTNLDDRDKLHLQSALRSSYYPSHLNGDIQGACVYPSEMIPAMHHSPPTYSEHHDRSYTARGQPKSMQGGKSPMTSPMKANTRTEQFAATLPRKYENYPGHFIAGREARGNGVMYKSTAMRYNGGSGNGGNLNDGRTSANERDYTPSSLFTRQYSDPKIPRNGTYCIPRNHNDPWSIHGRQMSNPQPSTAEQSQDSSVMAAPPQGGGVSHPSGRHMNAYSSNGTTTTNISSSSSSSTATGSIVRHKLPDRQYYTLSHPKRVNFAPNTAAPAAANANLQQKEQQPGQSYSSGDAAAAVSNEPYQTLNSLSKIDPISNWDAQDRMKIAVDHMDPCHLLSGPCIPFEYVSTDPSVVESQLTVDESVMGSHQMFESQGGGEGMPNLLDPIDINMRLREDEIDSILTDSEVGVCRVMNHFPSADCSSQYTATIVAGSSSTSGDSTPRDHDVFIMPPSQQSFDV